MAEFCENCASKYDMKPDPLPLLCEGCGRFISTYKVIPPKNIIDRVLNLFRK